MYVARMEENNNTLTLLAGRPEGRRALERGKPRWGVIFILIKSIRWGLDLSGSRYLQMSGLCERGDKIFRFHKTPEISWLAKDLSSYKEGFRSRESLLLSDN